MSIRILVASALLAAAGCVPEASGSDAPTAVSASALQPESQAVEPVFYRSAQIDGQTIAYREAGPHLMLMAFLQRIVNGGGSIAREFALGSGRADLMVSFAGQRHALELKVRRDEGTVQQGIEQLSAYLDRMGLRDGSLVLFDRSSRPWEEKLYQSQAQGPGGQEIYVYGM